MVALKSDREIKIMREAADILKDVFIRLKDFVKPGIRTIDIDSKAEKIIRSLKVEPAFLGYYGFPACVCTSVNEQVVHGIPSDRVLKDGDIISLDIGVKHKGYFSDAARTWPVGKISHESEQLIEVTKQSLFEGLTAATQGSRIGDLSNKIQKYVESFGYGVVRDFVGHGIGVALHEDPQVPNFGQPGRGILLEQGLVIAIEPMVNMGRPEVKILDDGWTVVTKDGSLSAHHEETVVISKDGPEVLTNFEKD
ncbi:MAG: type I methionyl aminopeptidase [Candidatus Omnitrophica bacterium]|nr:type I methionyl aminopeptidase [Candidatus Omnitrophota bacterium]